MHTQTGKSPWANLSDDNICLARYTKWGEAYAAKEEKKKSKAKGRDMPDPNKVIHKYNPRLLLNPLEHFVLTQVPPGTDPVAWRKYCQDTVEYWEKYDRAHQ